MGNKQLSDSFKVLEQRRKSVDVPRPLVEGKKNRSMQDLISEGEASNKRAEEGEVADIIIFIVGGMTYSEIRYVRYQSPQKWALGWALGCAN